MAGTNFEIDYNDPRFQQIKLDGQVAAAQSDQQYDQMISSSNQYYNDAIDSINQNEATQSKLQQDRTDFTINKIEQDKEKAQKDYTKEQSGAYVDWQKQSNQYGANAEQMASSGMQGTGYSESSQVQMYTAYQNRVAVARETFNQAVVDYNNSITEARLANDSVLAEIAMNALNQRVTLGMEKMQYQNTLLQSKIDAQREIERDYYNRGQDALAQMNFENSEAEKVRQFNETMDYNKYRDEVSDLQWQANFDEGKRQFDVGFAEEQRQFDTTMDYNRYRDQVADKQWQANFDEGKRQFDTTLDYNQSRDKVADEQWLAEFNEGQRQFDVGTAEEQRQFDAGLAEDQRQFNVGNEIKNTESLTETLENASAKQEASKSTSGKTSGKTTEKTTSKNNEAVINKDNNNNNNDGGNNDEPPKVKDNGVVTTNKNKEFTATQQQNIVNSLMKNSKPENQAYWKAEIDKWYKEKKITKAQRTELMNTVG